MKNALLKKSIFVITVILTIVGVSLFAYWMSDILAPDDVEEDIVVVIGVGAATGTNLKVKEAVQELGLTFVPATRIPDKLIVYFKIILSGVEKGSIFIYKLINRPVRNADATVPMPIFFLWKISTMIKKKRLATM